MGLIRVIVSADDFKDVLAMYKKGSKQTNPHIANTAYNNTLPGVSRGRGRPETARACALPSFPIGDASFERALL